MYKQRCAKIALSGIWEHGDHPLPRPQPPGQAQGRRHIGTAGYPTENPFPGGQLPSRPQRFLIRDHAYLIVDGGIEIGRYQSVTDAHLEMGAHAASRKDGGIFRLYRPNGHPRILFP